MAMLRSARCAPALVMALAAAAAAQERMPNVGYLGSGYNVFYGNPHATGRLDPGFQGQVLDLTYAESSTTSDGHYLIPDKTHAVRVYTCKSEFTSRVIYGAKSLREELDVNVGGHFGGFGAAFSASSDYRHVSERTSSHKSVFTESTAMCTVYKVSAAEYTPPRVTEDFLRAVSQLPVTFDAETAAKVYQFIANFGTHVMMAVEMGGQYGQRSEFTQENWRNMVVKDLDVVASIGYSGQVSAGVHLNVSKAKNQTEEFMSSAKSQYVFNVGGKYSESSDGWIASVRAEPMPVVYTLRNLTEVMSPNFLPSLSASFLAGRQAALGQGIATYCAKLRAEGAVSNCDPPKPDPIVEMRAWKPWSNAVHNGVSNGVHECGHLQYIKSLQWKTQRGYGLVDLRLTCTDGEQFTFTNNRRGVWAAATECDKGFSQVQGRQQPWYGLVNFGAVCHGDDIERYTDSNWKGSWNEMLICPDEMSVAVGVETEQLSDYGLVNFRVRCSNGDVATVAPSQLATAGVDLPLVI